MNFRKLNNKEIIKIIKNALQEDKVREDITSLLLIPERLKVSAKIIAKDEGIICGLPLAQMIFKTIDKNVKFKAKVKDGDRIRKDLCIAYMSGKARAILSAERTVLNFLGRLSGIATLTNKFVEKVKNYNVKIFDTRKTTPTLRLLEKYAVRCGGGFNHRFNLKEAILIKDNHIACLKQKISLLKKNIDRNRKKIQKTLEIEVNNLEEFKEALKINPEIIMLDNFTIQNIKKAVALRGRRKSPELEASGGVNLINIKKIAASGVDRISIGALTHSANSLDFSLEII
jgi:nicotinate-nucleotide pyrophosphorylase (carboxylating)